MKTKTLFLLSAILLAFLMLASACYRVEEMSDINEFHRLKITSYTPEIEVRNEARIEGDIIFIDVDFGEFHFPLRFSADYVLKGEIDRFVNIDFTDTLELESIRSELTFYVMAKSGLARRYTIRVAVADLDRNVAISRHFEILEQDPNDMMISEEGVTVGFEDEDGQRRDTLIIFTVAGKSEAGRFPVTIRPEFHIERTSHFGEIRRPDGTTLPFDNGTTSLTFNNENSIYNLTVISASGFQNTWAIMMYHAPFVSGGDGGADIENTNMDPRFMSATLQGTGFQFDNEIIVNNDTEQISLVLKADESFAFPLSAQVSLNISGGVQLFNLDESDKHATSTTLTFESWDDVHTFYLLDIHSRVSRLWTIGLREWKSSENNVLENGFTFAYTASMVCTRWGTFSCAEEAPAIELDVDRTIIRSRTNTVGDIFLYMTEVRNSTLPLLIPREWRLTLSNMQVEVSDGATYQLPATLVWTGNESWRQPRSFTVTAEDGSVKTWFVNIRDMRDHVPSADADLLNFVIDGTVPNFAGFVNPATIDREKNIVTLNLTDDYNVYPLRVYFSAEVSPFAQVTSQNPMVFEDENSTQTLTITAENGTATSDWTVRLQPPPREAQVLDFQVTRMSGGQLAQVAINNDAGTIRLWLTAPATFPVDVVYTMTISPRATASVPLRGGTFTFNSYQDIQSFTLTAQDGSTRDWSVRLASERQLPNWTLDEWTNATTPVNWSTANNTFVTGTRRTAGNPATGFGAELRTSLTEIFGISRLAAGSIFIGEFHFSIAGMDDPISLTHFGVPFETPGQIRGMEFDVIYSPGARYNTDGSRELGSATIELLKPIPGRENEPWRYHGSRPEGGALPAGPHPNNTAMPVAHAQMVIGNAPGTAFNGLPITVVSNTTWTRVQLLFDFPGGVKPEFTRLHVVFSSSAQGDLFRGVPGSTLRVDNVRILYKEDE